VKPATYTWRNVLEDVAAVVLVLILAKLTLEATVAAAVNITRWGW
jgi:hypothetical protein